MPHNFSKSKDIIFIKIESRIFAKLYFFLMFQVYNDVVCVYLYYDIGPTKEITLR